MAKSFFFFPSLSHESISKCETGDIELPSDKASDFWLASRQQRTKKPQLLSYLVTKFGFCFCVLYFLFYLNAEASHKQKEKRKLHKKTVKSNEKTIDTESFSMVTKKRKNKCSFFVAEYTKIKRFSKLICQLE